MRIRQIGTLVFDANTNIIVDANNQDAPGVGFRADSLFDPQPFAAEIAFRRATRQQALDAVSNLARELHSYAQRRRDNLPSVAGGALVVVEDANGGTTLRSYLRDAVVTLLSVEATSTGFLARVRVTGTLVNPFLNYSWTQTTLSALLPYERRVVALSGLSAAYLYRNDLVLNPILNMTGLYNVLLAIEELGGASETSRITAINPATATSGVTLQNWDAGWATLTRANFTSATSGTITYNITPSIPQDVYRLFIEIFCPTVPSTNARYLVSWGEQPQIAETISGDRTWYAPTLIVPDVVPFPLTLEIQNVPNGTLVMPLVLIPTDGVYIWNIIAPPTILGFHIFNVQTSNTRPFRVIPSGIIYGAPGFISSRFVAVFNGMMAPTIINSSATLSVYSRRIEPAAFA